MLGQSTIATRRPFPPTCTERDRTPSGYHSAVAGTDLLEQVGEQHPLDARVNTTLLVASIALSVMRLLGSNLDFLIPSPESWPSSIWTLFTTCMLHGDWLHLLFNVFWLLRLGTAVEGLIGSTGMAFFLVLTALGSGALQWAFDGAFFGLSGIVYGTFGLLWALDRWHPQGKDLMDGQTKALLVIWFFLCLLLDSTGAMPIANWAHGIGALLGGVLGWSLSRPADQRGWRWFAFPLASMGCLLIPLLRTPTPVTLAHAARLFGQGTLKVQDGKDAFKRGDRATAQTLFEEAETILRASIEVSPFPSTYFNLSIALGGQGKTQESAEMYNKAIELDPDLEQNSEQ